MSENYDFETLLSRKGQGSFKWEAMYREVPNLSDDIVPFSVADMELKIAPEIRKGLKKYIDEAILGYTGATNKYYEAVISWMKRRHNFEVEKDWIVCTSGVVAALYTGVKAYLKEGEGAIIFTPVYYPFYNAIKSSNRKIVDCGLIETDGYYEIDFEKFEEFAKDENNKMLILCSPHNPVGRVWKREELEKIGKIALENDLIIISDEIHCDILMPGFKHTVLQTLSDELAEITVTCTAPTKSFNLAGIGVSNIIIKNKKLRKQFEAQMTKDGSHVFAALGFKACEEKFIGFKAPLIEGTYLQWLDFRALGLKDEELKAFMTKKANAFFNEGYIFGKAGSRFERINLAVPTRYIEAVLERIYNAIKKEYPKFCK